MVAAGRLSSLLVSTRHVNAVLCSILPGYFLLLLTHLGKNFREKNHQSPFAWKSLAVSILVGIAALALLKATTFALCLASDVSMCSRAGYTFQWRLVKFSHLDAPTKQAVWTHVLPALTGTPELQQILTTHIIPDDQSLCAPGSLAKFLQQAFQTEDPRETKNDATFQADQQLNLLARAFILHAGLPYWQLVFNDWLAGFLWTNEDLAREPFRTTFYFQEIPESKSARTICALPSYAWFKQLGSRAAYDANLYLSWTASAALPLWSLLLLEAALLLALTLTKNPLKIPALLFIIASTSSGLVLWWGTKMLTDQLPRFILPLYCIVLFSILLGLSILLRKTPVVSTK